MVKREQLFCHSHAQAVSFAERPNRPPRYFRVEAFFGGLAMSAIGSASGAKSFAISATADSRHDHLCFERQQSLALREMEWEGRLKPQLPWSILILRGLAALAAAGLVLAILI